MKFEDVIDEVKADLARADFNFLHEGKIDYHFKIDVVTKFVLRSAQKYLELDTQQDTTIDKLKHEIEVLRKYGNKDCIAMADEELSLLPFTDTFEGFSVGEVIRYADGSTAFMKIIKFDKRNRNMYGEQYFGGTVGCTLERAKKLTADEKKTWNMRKI